MRRGPAGRTFEMRPREDPKMFVTTPEITKAVAAERHAEASRFRRTTAKAHRSVRTESKLMPARRFRHRRSIAQTG